MKTLLEFFKKTCPFCDSKLSFKCVKNKSLAEIPIEINFSFDKGNLKLYFMPEYYSGTIAVRQSIVDNIIDYICIDIATHKTSVVSKQDHLWPEVNIDEILKRYRMTMTQDCFNEECKFVYSAHFFTESLAHYMILAETREEFQLENIDISLTYLPQDKTTIWNQMSNHIELPGIHFNLKDKSSLKKTLDNILLFQ